jgi:hypothetical protein
MMDIVTRSVDFNCASALSLREFVALQEVETDYSEIIYHGNFKVVQSGVCLLKQFLCICLNDVKLFMENNCRSIDKLKAEGWINDRSFLVDVTGNLRNVM